MKTHKITHLDDQHGLVLLEGLIAVLIFSIGILGAVGLQTAMINGNADARYRAEAGLIVEQRIAELWVDQANLDSKAEPEGTDIPALPNGKRFTIRSGEDCGNKLSCFIVRVTWQQPGDDEEHNVTSVARITGGI